MGDVSGISDDQTGVPSTERNLGRWERWTIDWDGQPIVEFDSEAHEKWLEKWAPPCHRRVRRALGSGSGTSPNSNFESPLAAMTAGYVVSSWTNETTRFMCECSCAAATTTTSPGAIASTWTGPCASGSSSRSASER